MNKFIALSLVLSTLTRSNCTTQTRVIEVTQRQQVTPKKPTPKPPPPTAAKDFKALMQYD